MTHTSHPVVDRPRPSGTAWPERLRAFLGSGPAEDVLGTGPRQEIACPATGEVLGSVPSADAADVARAVEQARAAQRAWAARPARERARVMLDLHDVVRANEELLLDLIQAETGKARIHAYDEVMDAYIVCRFVGLSTPKVLAEQRRRGAVPGLTSTRVQHVPVGVVGFVTPWNYPMSLGANDLLSALAAGNAVVHKPDSRTVLTAVLMRRLAVQAGLPGDLWQLVPGDVQEVGTPLLEAADAVSFTGSTPAGRRIAEATGPRLVPTVLELGGKNPMIVREDASLDRAVAAAVRGCFASTGQLCLSVERIYVVGDARRFREFCAEFADAAAALRVGFGFDDRADVGSLISAEHRERVESMVEDASSKGARVLAGGRARPDLGPAFFEPTVLVGVPEDAELARAETFGPVVALYRVDTDDAAVAAANDTEFGLNASVVTGSARDGLAVASRLESGMVNVNEAFAAAWGSVAAPSGGFKASGLGHRHGPEGILQFTRPRTVALQRGPLIAPAGPGGPERFRRTMTAALGAMKAAHWR